MARPLTVCCASYSVYAVGLITRGSRMEKCCCLLYGRHTRPLEGGAVSRLVPCPQHTKVPHTVARFLRIRRCYRRCCIRIARSNCQLGHAGNLHVSINYQFLSKSQVGVAQNLRAGVAQGLVFVSIYVGATLGKSF